MGVEKCDREFRLPDYLRLQVSPFPVVDATQSRILPRPISQQMLSQIIFQIVSHEQFVWYISFKRYKDYKDYVNLIPRICTVSHFTSYLKFLNIVIYF